jgi:hypothetical protein
MNMWGFTPQLFPALRGRFVEFLNRSDRDDAAEFLLPEAIQSLVRDREFRVEVLRGGGRWCGVTFREDLDRARASIRSLVDQGRYPAKLWS